MNPTQNRGFHIAHLNCQSIKNKFDIVQQQIISTNFDIFTLSEAWLITGHSSSLLEIPCYNLIRYDRSWHHENNAHPKVGGGLLFYIKSPITFSYTDLEFLNSSSPNIEIIWIKILNPNHRDYIIGITYRPPQGSPKEFSNHIEYSLNHIDHIDKFDLFILGDMNINYSDLRSPSRKHLKRLENIFGLKQLIKEPTRISPTTNSTLLSSRPSSRAY